METRMSRGRNRKIKEKPKEKEKKEDTTPGSVDTYTCTPVPKHTNQQLSIFYLGTDTYTPVPKHTGTYTHICTPLLRTYAQHFHPGTWTFSHLGL